MCKQNELLGGLLDRCIQGPVSSQGTSCAGDIYELSRQRHHYIVDVNLWSLLRIVFHCGETQK
jgi:hypothetical protein